MNAEGSAWSVAALKEYMDRRFQTMTEAVAVANKAMDLRLEAMNEFRTQILNERQDFLGKKDFESRHSLLESQFDRDIDKVTLRLDALERWQAKLLGAMALVLIMLPSLTALTIYYITRHTHVPSVEVVTVPVNAK